MRFLFKSKDGGADSNVTGYWLVENKDLFSIVLLCFDKGSREAYHNHAFNALSWILKGELNESIKYSNAVFCNLQLTASIKPIFTPRSCMHKVTGIAEKTWVISFRGPWTKTWKEYFTSTNKEVTLTNGRKIVP